MEGGGRPSSPKIRGAAPQPNGIKYLNITMNYTMDRVCVAAMTLKVVIDRMELEIPI
jgi:hypothetical protein